MDRAGITGARQNIKPYPLIDLADRTINVSDPDSRNLKTTRGWVQGYNAQAVVTAAQIVIAAEISTESLDTANLQPMMTAAEEELHAAGVAELPGVVLADAGYWKSSAIETLCGQGIATLVAPDADRRKEPGPAAAAASMTSRGACSPPTGARSSTSSARAASSPCSDRSKPTAAPTASYAADDQPSDRNGGS
jgi:hypothetical protein